MESLAPLDQRAVWVLDYVAKRGLAHIPASVAEETGFAVSDLYGRRRYGPLVAARRRLVAAFYDATYSFSETARLTGLDHTTVLHHVRLVVADMLDLDVEVLGGHLARVRALHGARNLAVPPPAARAS